MAGKTPTADEIKTWTTSRLLECYAQVIASNNSNWAAQLRRLYAAEIDRRFPVPK